MSIKMRRFLRKLNNREGGFTLIEVLCALAILGIIAIGLFSALGTSLKTTGIADEQATARNLAESQMEYVKKQGYASSYPPAQIPSEYVGYSVAIEASNIPGRDENIQKITVTILHQNKGIKKLEGFKVN